MEQFQPTERTKVKRSPKRGHYQKEIVFGILDSASICHVGFNHEQNPVVIPTIYGRKDDAIYLHGAIASRMLSTLEQGLPVCISVALVDGLVLARSAFHHSMNYRSVVIFGTATLVTNDEEKIIALKAISDQVLKGRWEEARQPNEKELKATKVLKIKVEEASAKIRTGKPIDEEEDYALDIWAGEIPLATVALPPVNDPELKDDIAIPDSVRKLYSRNPVA